MKMECKHPCYIQHLYSLLVKKAHFTVRIPKTVLETFGVGYNFPNIMLTFRLLSIKEKYIVKCHFICSSSVSKKSCIRYGWFGIDGNKIFKCEIINKR